MKIGATLLSMTTSDTCDNLDYLKQLGVEYVVFMNIVPPDSESADKNSVGWKLMQSPYFKTEDLTETRRWVEEHGLKLFAICPSADRLNLVKLGKPGRDEQIENWCKSIQNMGLAGIPVMHYSWRFDAGASMPLWRTSSIKGRGGAKITRFDYSVAKKVPITEIGEVTEEQMWDNLTYFLKAVIPIAEKYGVKMTMHPADPQVPSLAGIARIIRSVQDYDRLFEIVPSPSNSIVFCLGCFAQMLEPEEVYNAIRYFGKRGKIGYVHFRNVIGNREKFDEVYPDEGKLDMLKAINTLKEIGYTGSLIPDHSPIGTGDTEYGHIGHAFQLGYLKGLLQGANAIE